MRQLTVQELQAQLQAEPASRPRLLDVREPWEFQLARIDGSELVPMQTIPQQVDALDRSHPTVVICHHGTRSLQVVAFLERMGFQNLHNLQGGIDAWARQIDTRVPLY
ncbi:MAG: rhodanese-like domain-containing protein [Usitatibacteraceae bacterium]